MYYLILDSDTVWCIPCFICFHFKNLLSRPILSLIYTYIVHFALSLHVPLMIKVNPAGSGAQKFVHSYLNSFYHIITREIFPPLLCFSLYCSTSICLHLRTIDVDYPMPISHVLYHHIAWYGNDLGRTFWISSLIICYVIVCAMDEM